MRRARPAFSHWRRAASRLLEIGLRRYAMPRDSRFQTGSFFMIERIVLDSVRQFRERARETFALVDGQVLTNRSSLISQGPQWQPIGLDLYADA
jgi:hypothetical protein